MNILTPMFDFEEVFLEPDRKLNRIICESRFNMVRPDQTWSIIWFSIFLVYKFESNVSKYLLRMV